MRQLPLYIIAVIFLSIVACKGKKDVAQPAPPPPPTIDTMAVVTEEPTPEVPAEPVQAFYYERTVCFGTCPSFSFEVFSDGKCTYNGRNFVDMIGMYKGQATEAQMNAIRLQAIALGYDTLQEKYDQPMVSDLPATITVIDGKRVMNRYQGPDLKLLYAELDSMILRVNWEGVENKNQ
ncbi:MAG: DUF6438 domain-containing protein [Flavobacteriales bacterium]|nr:DUF6438 domain-containing protein [Flavobacteriales bacterium]